MEKITVRTNSFEELIDITGEVKDYIQKESVSNGAVLVYCPHTTAGITINENADPSVKSDILLALRSIDLEDLPFTHSEGNSPSHVKASLMGCSVMIIVENGRPVLGTWQGIFFCEFDGPRTRHVYISKV